MPDTTAGAVTAFPPSILATAAPAIPTARAWAAAYRGAAGPALDLTQAVPGYPPHPDLLVRLGEEAARTANAGYGPIEGEAGLREALAADLAHRYRAPLDPADVVITAGCNLAFVMTMTAIAGPGSAVLLPAPWYFNHHMALTMLGIATIPLPCRAEDGSDARPRPGEKLADAARAVTADPSIRVETAECLGNCKRRLSAALVKDGGWSYVFGDLALDNAADLIEGARLFQSSDNGLIPWRGRPDCLKRGLISRIPPLSMLKEQK